MFTDLDFPKFFTTHVKNAVLPMSADTFCGLPDLPSVVRNSKYGSPVLSPTFATSVVSFVLKRPETFNTSENKKKIHFVMYVILIIS